MLDDPQLGLTSKVLERLWNPLHGQPCHNIDADTHMVIDLYLGNPSEATYETNCSIILHCFPDMNIPSYYKAKHLVADLMGIESVMYNMCINLCVAYTGIFLELDACPMCSEPWYNQF